jgi:hypothetical protein
MENVKTWIEDWHKLFPKRTETSTSGYLLGTPENCVNKMQKLCKEHATYTKDVIFAATQMYLTEKKAVNYTYLCRPNYFINKLERGSMLAEYCERVLANEKPTIQKITPEYNPVNDFI